MCYLVYVVITEQVNKYWIHRWNIYILVRTSLGKCIKGGDCRAPTLFCCCDNRATWNPIAKKIESKLSAQKFKNKKWLLPKLNFNYKSLLFVMYITYYASLLKTSATHDLCIPILLTYYIWSVNRKIINLLLLSILSINCHHKIDYWFSSNNFEIIHAKCPHNLICVLTILII